MTSGVDSNACETRTKHLADHNRASLGAYLAIETHSSKARALRAAARTLRHAFSRDAARDAAWDDASLQRAGIGSWAREAVHKLSPELSLTVAECAPSEDGTTRLLLKAQDGALFESVIIPASAGRDHLRTTLCVSSQAGCARACTFCETGSLGLERQLTCAEIVDQYRIANRICTADQLDDLSDPLAGATQAPTTSAGFAGPRAPVAHRTISNIVFMGMGEAFDNLRNVTRAIDLLSDVHAFDFAPSRITVSTVGVADRFEEFFASTRAELAISLNAPDDRRRSLIMPINDRFDLATLRRRLLAALPPRRRVLFQYVIFAGFNDSASDADALADYVTSVPCRINVIPANPGPDPTLRAPDKATVDAFVERLASRGITTLVRRPRGRDVGGACGQLAGSARRLVPLGRKDQENASCR